MLKPSYCPQLFAARWERAVGTPALGRGQRGATGSSPGLIRRSRAHKTRFSFFLFFSWLVGDSET